MLVRDAVEIYLQGIQDFTKATQRVETQRLTFFAQWCEEQHLELEQITNAHIRQFTQFLSTTPAETTSRKRSSYTVSGYIMVVKTFLGWIANEPGLEDLVKEKMVKRIQYPTVTKKVIAIFTEEQLHALFAACEQEKDDRLVYRDKAILSLLVDPGPGTNAKFL
jgi:site-specific recombinase XerD